MPHPLYEILDCSHNRKVFVVGDIHGEYRKLDAALDQVGFDGETDVLLSVGDLVDRGPCSEEFETYIGKPWFHRVRGNHDDQPREYLLGYESTKAVAGNGGQWLLDKPREEIERLATVLEDAPLLLTVTTPAGHRVGLAHADIGGHWDWMEGQCQDPDLERYLVNLITASRVTIHNVQTNPNVTLAEVKVRGSIMCFMVTPLSRTC